MRTHDMKPVLDPALFDAAAVSEETARFNAELEATLADLPATHEVPVEVTRKAREEGRGIFPIRGPLPGSDWTELPNGNRVRISPAPQPRGIFLHIHGGGWTLGSPEHFDLPNQAIAAGTGLTVVSVKYRLAPEHVWPAQLDDCLAAFDWVRGQWPDLPVVIGGESAGGHLSAALLVALRDAGRMARVSGAVFNYGCFDMRMTASMALWGPRKLVLSTPTVAWFIDNVMPEVAVRSDPVASPLLAGLSGMPPALFQVGTSDPLLDDTLQLSARWAGAGIDTALAVYPGGVHAFDAFDIDIARAFRARQIEFINGCV
ncbi:alpha/beta hydrolase [Paroceanicella profunda]|uniref:Alpha/beta hydrolase n=1 Tax=Paroceanicella profunda TaxID=2579971 RepID=A0A5B8FWU5_9RHOB|nr:alpha/beta hydrolase [Paroceanicella profunda]QDL93366.1 alpha/beta hydrolase [Paroceanicella profunda]